MCHKFECMMVYRQFSFFFLFKLSKLRLGFKKKFEITFQKQKMVEKYFQTWYFVGTKCQITTTLRLVFALAFYFVCSWFLVNYSRHPRNFRYLRPKLHIHHHHHYRFYFTEVHRVSTNCRHLTLFSWPQFLSNLYFAVQFNRLLFAATCSLDDIIAESIEARLMQGWPIRKDWPTRLYLRRLIISSTV